MERFTLAWVVFTLCLCSVSGKPTKQMSALFKTMVKRWDLIVENDPILSQNPPADCQNIIDDYSKGKLLMYEYKIQINRCMKKAKGDADSTADADVKSALLRPDSEPTEDTVQAVNVRPYSTEEQKQDFDEDSETGHSDFSALDNDNDDDYKDDDDSSDEYDGPEEKAAKKMQVPTTADYQAPVLPVQNYDMPAQQPEMPGQQAAFYYSSAAQTPYNGALAQNPVPDQTQAAFASNPINQYPANPAPFQVADRNMGMNAVAKNTIPDNTQTQQPPAFQANAVFDRWRASSFGAAAATKKDETPSAPVAPSNDQFAEFMKLQASTGNAAEASPANQQAAMPAAMQQRSDVPQQPSLFPAQVQSPNTVPGPSQAFYIQPEEHGDFPENP